MAVTASSTAAANPPTTTSEPPSMSMAATATAAAAGTLPINPSTTGTIPTPLSATYPASLHSPLPSATFQLKREDASIKTPLTPPSAYVDFLKALSPAHSRGFASPLNTGASAAFSFSNLNSPSTWQSSSDNIRTTTRTIAPNSRNYPYPQGPATARPALTSTPSNSSNESAPSTTSAPEQVAANSSKPMTKAPPPASAASQNQQRSNSTGQIPTASTSSRRPSNTRRPSLMIPESPSSSSFAVVLQQPSQSSSAVAASPAAARSPLSAPAGRSTAWSPIDWESLRTPSQNSRPVSVRHVVTRTVTYHRPTASGGPPLSAVAPTSRVQFPAASSQQQQQRQVATAGIKRAAGDSFDSQSRPKYARKKSTIEIAGLDEEDDVSMGDTTEDDESNESASTGTGTGAATVPEIKMEADTEDKDAATAAGAPEVVVESRAQQAATRQSPRRHQQQQQQRVGGFVKPLVGDAPKGKRRKADSTSTSTSTPSCSSSSSSTSQQKKQ